MVMFVSLLSSFSFFLARLRALRSGRTVYFLTKSMTATIKDGACGGAISRQNLCATLPAEKER